MVVSRWKENIQWTQHSPYPVVICNHGSGLAGGCDVPVNKGAEASAFLKYILGYWNTLPDTIIFVDAHETSWHQSTSIFPRIEAYRGQDYWGLNDVNVDTQDNKNWNYDKFKQIWDSVVFPHLHQPCPKRIQTNGSAQFIVTKAAIRRHSKELYADLYAYTIGSKRWTGDASWADAIGFSYQPGGPPDSHVGGAFFLEWIWEIIFHGK